MRLQNLEKIKKDHDFIYSTVEKPLRRQAAHKYNELIDTGSTPDEALIVIQDTYLEKK